jgi:hypothetical protein
MTNSTYKLASISVLSITLGKVGEVNARIIEKHRQSKTYRPCFVKRGQPTIYQFYRRSKKVAPFEHITNALRGRTSPTYLGYSSRSSCHLFQYHRRLLLE